MLDQYLNTLSMQRKHVVSMLLNIFSFKILWWITYKQFSLPSWVNFGQGKTIRAYASAVLTIKACTK